MKKAGFLAILGFMAALSFGQDITYESAHYTVTSLAGPVNAQNTAEELEAYLQVFNNYFRFNLSQLPAKLRVRIFDSKDSYGDYLQRIINERRDGFVYLHYSSPSRSELVGYFDANNNEGKESLIHQAFIQFLRAFIANPPLWLREGFAIYFENSQYDSQTKTAGYKENLAWLETFKSQVYGQTPSLAIPIEKLLQMDTDGAKASIKTFYPQAWALVNYLVQTDNRDHNRIMWDAIHALKAQAPLDENSTAAAKAFGWNSFAKVTQAEAEYYQAKETLSDLIQTGIDLYNNSKLSEAERTFNQALATNTENFAPYYYLGLINYDLGNYQKAESFYKMALEKGAGPATTNYALGVNAFADRRFDSAITYLNASKNLDKSYSERVANLLQRIEVERKSGK